VWANFSVIHIECINDNFYSPASLQFDCRTPHRAGKIIVPRVRLWRSCGVFALVSFPLFDKFPCSYICRLPVPWLLYGIIYGEPVEVSSEGMVCSITILFLMLLFVIISIACFRWKMNKGLGLIMFLLYFVFVAISLTFEYEWYKCPL
jgi:hypothetical protein